MENDEEVDGMGDKEEMITPKQLGLVHVLREHIVALKDDDAWRKFLREKFGVESSKELTKAQGVMLIDELKAFKQKAFEEKVESVSVKKEGEETEKIIIEKVLENTQEKITPSVEQILVQKADELDEELIIKEHIEGSEPLVYKIGDKYVLSIAGLFEASRRYGNIEIVDAKTEREGNKIIGKAWVFDRNKNNKIIGIAERYTNQEFYITTLVNKAIRNALRRVVPRKILDEVMKEGLEAKSILIIREL